MDIAIIRTNSSPINLGTYNVQEVGLAKQLMSYDFDIDFFSKIEKESSCPEIKGVKNRLKIIKINGLSIFNSTFTFLPLIYIFKKKYSFVQVQEYSQIMTPFILFLAKIKGSKTIIYQGLYSDFSGIKSIIQKMYEILFKPIIIKNSDIVLAKTSAAKKYMMLKGFKKVEVVNVGIDKVIRKENYELINTLKLFVNNFDFVLCYIGVFEKRRNVIFILELLNKMNDRQVGLILLGDGPEKKNLQVYISNKNLTEKVLFLSPILNSEVGIIYEFSNIFLLPSKYEIYGMVILEALYHGLPVIASKTAGPLEILQEKFLGECMELNYDDWMKSINRFRSLTSHKTERREFIEDKFYWDKIVKEYLQYVK